MVYHGGMRRQAVWAALVASVPALWFFVAVAQPADAIQLPAPNVTVTVPRLVTVTVPGPRVTVKAPEVTITRTVTLPPRTVTIHPGGSVALPTQTVTRTVTAQPAPRPVPTGAVSPSGQTVTQGGTMTTSPSGTSTKNDRIQPDRIVTKEKRVQVTVPEAIGYSLLLILLGVGLGILGLYAAYRLGYKDGDSGNRRFLRELREMIKR